MIRLQGWLPARSRYGLSFEYEGLRKFIGHFHEITVNCITDLNACVWIVYEDGVTCSVCVWATWEMLTVGVCLDDGCFEQPHLAQSDWTLGLGEASHLLCIKQSFYRFSTTHTQGDLLHGNMEHLRGCLQHLTTNRLSTTTTLCPGL